MVILSVSIYVMVAGCGAAETLFFFSLTIEFTAPWQPRASELTSVGVSWHQQNPMPFYFPLAFFSISDTIRIGSSLEAGSGFPPRCHITELSGAAVPGPAPAPSADAPSLANSPGFQLFRDFHLDLRTKYSLMTQWISLIPFWTHLYC